MEFEWQWFEIVGCLVKELGNDFFLVPGVGGHCHWVPHLDQECLQQTDPNKGVNKALHHKVCLYMYMYMYIYSCLRWHSCAWISMHFDFQNFTSLLWGRIISNNHFTVWHISLKTSQFEMIAKFYKQKQLGILLHMYLYDLIFSS